MKSLRDVLLTGRMRVRDGNKGRTGGDDDLQVWMDGSGWSFGL
jgi:hypothetical protein